jgi:hypothetical protein
VNALQPVQEVLCQVLPLKPSQLNEKFLKIYLKDRYFSFFFKKVFFRIIKIIIIEDKFQ